MGIQMSIGLRIALIIFVMGIGCIFSGDVQATEKQVANKTVARKSVTKPAAQKSTAVKTKKQNTARTTKTAKVTRPPVKTAKIANSAKFSKTSKKTQLAKTAKPIAPVAVDNPGELSVQSGAALVVEQYPGGQALFQKNAHKVVPIASITKLMTAMVVLDNSPPMEAPITITDDDVDYLKGSRSRLPVGSVLSRKTALLLALMSSENRAANALARHYPGGMGAFLSAMNKKAKDIGMMDTRFEDPTGLTRNNVSTAVDLAKMVAAAHTYQLIREFSTTAEAKVAVGGQNLEYRNTNPLVKNAAWDVGISKTGYISEAGKCLVMQAQLAEKPVVIVLLDSVGTLTRVGDANRIKHWIDRTNDSNKMSMQTLAMQKRGHKQS
jgi:serine-type D-Ala-D-Ala endopeptidase (penicillin-binding protein 7)